MGKNLINIHCQKQDGFKSLYDLRNTSDLKQKNIYIKPVKKPVRGSYLGKIHAPTRNLPTSNNLHI